MCPDDIGVLETKVAEPPSPKELAERAFEAAREPLAVLDTRLAVRLANAAFCRTFGVVAREIVGKTIDELRPGEGRHATLQRRLDQALSDHRAFEGFEMNFHSPEAGQRILLVNARPVDGAPYLLIALEDVTEQRAAERRDRLNLEMRHRVKNVLSTVQATMRQTLKNSGSLAQFEQDFSGRLEALARAHDLLIKSHGRPCEIGDILDYVLAPFGAAQRVRVACRDLHLLPDPAISLTLIVHELATNAAKHGALSVPDGSVEVVCWIPEDEPGFAMLRWREHDGPPVSPPSRHGFGTKLITLTARHDLNGEAETIYRPEGIDCVVRFAIGGTS